mmetsp:Transcript_11590/g.10104  ORF Transcript_11590/g.10104 Transcript_11590/m.10104 type:complete len:99 (+) Transcript_11590:2032-2328(+)
MLVKTKHILKNFLIEIEDISSILRLSSDQNMTLQDLLERYKNELQIDESKQLAQQDRTPFHVQARFLSSLLSRIPSSYCENNFRKLFIEMSDEFKQLI